MGKGLRNKLKKCWLVEADDYHDFVEAQNYYTQAGISTDFQEIGCYNREYMAVFWINEPTKEVRKFIKDIEKEIEELEDE